MRSCLESTPIFVDRNIHPSDYNHLDPGHLLVSKVFPTVQGEGPFAGRRSVFVRLGGCNLGGKGVTGPGCDFCDTDFRFDKAVVTDFETLYALIDCLYPNEGDNKDRRKLIVITGGEPMLQNQLVDFINNAPDDFHFQIESNGSRLLPVSRTRVYLVVSPKVLPGRGPSTHPASYHTLNKKVFARADCLKFVVTADDTSPYHLVPKYAFEFVKNGSPVYVSPMAVYKQQPKPFSRVLIWDSEIFDHEACIRNHSYAAKLVMEHGFRLNVQMQLYIGME